MTNRVSMEIPRVEMTLLLLIYKGREEKTSYFVRGPNRASSEVPVGVNW
jgi:hypothetical protein